MAAPFMLVTFTDADGDEFPIRVEGMWTRAQRSVLVAVARDKLTEFAEAGEMIPTAPLHRKVQVQLVGGGIGG